jgi:Tfp pilus assembly protein PilO
VPWRKTNLPKHHNPQLRKLRKNLTKSFLRKSKAMEKLKALAWYWQLLICIGISSAMYYGVYYFYTSGVWAEVQAVNDQVIALQSKNEAAKIATQRINEFRSLYATKQQEYDELKVLLPEEQEITNVLQSMQDTAKESHLIVNRFSPKDATQQDFVMAKSVEIEVDSNFDNLRIFFEKIKNLQRVVSITDFGLKQLDKQTADRTLHAQFLLTTYYASPENLTPAAIAPVAGQPVAAPVAGQPVAAPVAGQPAPPAPAK